MRGPINVSKLVGMVVAVVAVGLAVGLVVVSSTASFASAVVALTALVVSVAAFYSIETGLMALLLVASTDGFLRGLSPGWHTQVIKDYLLALPRGPRAALRAWGATVRGLAAGSARRRAANAAAEVSPR